jgi:hypothetical protein
LVKYGASAARSSGVKASVIYGRSYPSARITATDHTSTPEYNAAGEEIL